MDIASRRIDRLESLFLTKERAAIVFVASLLLAFLSFGLTVTETSEIVPTSALMSVNLTNSSDSIKNASLFIQARDVGNASRISFSNATFSVTKGENRTYLTSIVDGSGVEVYVKNMTAGEAVSFQIRNIQVSPELSTGPGQLRVELGPRGEETFYIDYAIVFSILARTRLGTFSVASIMSFNYRSGNVFEPLIYERTHETAYIAVFFALSFCLLSSLILWIAVPKWRKRVPLATLAVALSSVALYTFFGSGYEILSHFSSVSYAPGFNIISVLLHGYDDHLSGNLFYFLIVSSLLEIWLSVRETWKSFFSWYIFPLFLALVIQGIGLSLSIESMTWALWLKIASENMSFTRKDALMCVFSGLPSAAFLGWLIRYVQGGVMLYSKILAIIHIVYGVVSATIILSLFAIWSLRAHFSFIRQSISWLWERVNWKKEGS